MCGLFGVIFNYIFIRCKPNEYYIGALLGLGGITMAILMPMVLLMDLDYVILMIGHGI